MSKLADIAAKELITPSEFLRLERQALGKHEYHDGRVYAMAGGDPRHSRIKTNLITLSSVGIEFSLGELYEDLEFSGEGPVEDLPPPWGPCCGRLKANTGPGRPRSPKDHPLPLTPCRLTT